MVGFENFVPQKIQKNHFSGSKKKNAGRKTYGYSLKKKNDISYIRNYIYKKYIHLKIFFLYAYINF